MPPQYLLLILGRHLGWLLAVSAVWKGFLFSPLLAATPPASSPPQIEVLVDGQAIEATGAGFRVPASHKSVSFRLGKSAEDSGEGIRRVRFKLEGVDNAWRQMPSEMSLMVRFADAAGDQVGQQIFRVSEISAGWKGPSKIPPSGDDPVYFRNRLSGG